MRPLLATGVGLCDNRPMTDREIAIALIRKLPKDIRLREIARELEFVADERGRLRLIKYQEPLTVEKVKGMISSWDVK